ncbi:MAG: hypothetical protein QW683_08705 [Candidatus Caldarchaeum sp.]
MTFLAPRVIDGKAVFLSKDGSPQKVLSGCLNKITCKEWATNESLLLHFETENGITILSLPKTPYNGNKGSWKPSVLKLVSQLAKCDLSEPVTLRLFKGKVGDKEYAIIAVDQCDDSDILRMEDLRTSFQSQGVKFYPDPYRAKEGF